jgi:2-amino-4-hydroxy-6-hydroxymethyldihydropteridine diphosphokinase
MMLWRPAYVGIGSNLDEPRSQVTQAIERLRSLPDTRCVAVSTLYRSAPFGPIAQAEYVNAAAGLLTRLEPEALLAELHGIEAKMGRKRREKWGPRVVDLDLLVFAGVTRSGDSLALPHPGIVERNFVLYPLAEIAPDLYVPGLGRVAELARRVPAEGIWPI